MSKIVDIWAKGYADETGMSNLIVDDNATADQIASEARKQFGSFARVCGVRPHFVKQTDAELATARAYAKLFRGDNT